MTNSLSNCGSGKPIPFSDYIILHNIYFCAAEFSVRLHGGATPYEGRVEVLVEDEWGSIQDSQWDIHDATVICRQLGFSVAKVCPPAD